MLDFIFDNPGRNGVFNMIKVFSLLGEVDLGKKYLKYLINFGSALLNFEKLSVKYNTDIKYSDIINSNPNDWIIKGSENRAYFKKSKNIEIRWNDFGGKREFLEDWATNYPDKSAYMYNYKLYKDNSMVKEFNLVYVDGYRALLPIPS